MKYHIALESQALKDIAYFKKHDKAIVKKIENLLLEMIADPFIGSGKPEPLKFELSGYWSRRITLQHRLIYRLEKKEIIVISCRYYY